MRQGTYLNAILTVNAVLLAGLTWTQVSETAGFASTVHAQHVPPPGRSIPQGQSNPTIPNAAAQRNAIRTSVHELQKSVDALRRLMESGRLRVEVTNLDDIEVTID